MSQTSSKVATVLHVTSGNFPAAFDFLPFGFCATSTCRARAVALRIHARSA